MKLLVVLVAVMVVADAQPGAPPSIDQVLTESFGLSRADLAALRDRRAVVRALPSTDAREVATLGAISVAVSPRSYVRQLRDIAAFKRSDQVSQIGVFSRQPAAGEVQGLTLPGKDQRALQKCRPGRCDVQLSADAMTRIAQRVEWKSPQASDQANGAFRAEMARIAGAYLELGEAGMPLYHDTPAGTSMAVEFRSMVWDEPAPLREFDALAEHLRRFPGVTPGVEDILYWSREKMGNADVISITHLSIQAVSGRSPVTYIAASRQIYSTHYFDASLGLTILLAESADAPSSVMVYTNRSRADVFGGLLGPMKRSIAASRSRSALAKLLTTIRQRVEAPSSQGIGAWRDDAVRPTEATVPARRVWG